MCVWCVDKLGREGARDPADEYPPSFVQHRFRLPIESRVWITAVWITAVWITAVWITAVWTIAVWITTGQMLAAVCYCCVLQDAFAMCMYSMSFSNNMCACVQCRHPVPLCLVICMP